MAAATLLGARAVASSAPTGAARPRARIASSRCMAAPPGLAALRLARKAAAPLLGGTGVRRPCKTRGARARASRQAACSAGEAPEPAGASGPLRWWRDNRERARRLGAELRTYGLAGVLAYGLLNTAYYSCAFVLVWTCVLKVPAGLGTAGAVQRFGQVFALVYVGSQVTKLARAGGALLLAPLANVLLDRVEARLPQRFRSQGAAFTASVCACLALAALLFSTIVLLWS